MKNLLLVMICFIIIYGCNQSASKEENTDEEEQSEAADVLSVTLPENGQLVDGKPIGENWANILETMEDWNAEEEYWSLENGVLHGESTGGEFHHHSWTKTSYRDFELQAVFRMTGVGANSGVCIRLNPTSPDNAPGYQIDMGPGYWGCLWEERRAEMVQQFPEELANKIVNSDDWNHYYIRAEGHKIQAWLNGVQTIDTVQEEGFSEGSIGFQLCHGESNTILDVKTLYLRVL